MSSVQTVVNGVLTNYELINPKAKLPVLILPGWGQHSSHWQLLAPKLSSNFRVYILDLPGFGGTKNLKNNADVPDYCEFVHDFAAKAGLSHFILAGQSFGGQVAADFAIKYPKNLIQLILIDPAVIRERSLKTNLKIAVSKISKPLVRLLPAVVSHKIMSLYASQEYSQANEYQKSVLRQILKYNLGPKLHSIKVPVEIIWGSEDRVIPYKGKFLAEKIPQSNLDIIYGAGHHPHLSHPQKLALLLNKFAP